MKKVLSVNETKEKKRKRLVIIVTIAVMAIGWTLGFLFVLDSVFGFLDGFKTFIASLGVWSWIVFSALFIVITSAFFFIGGIGSSFIYLANMLFHPTMNAFILSTICLFAISLIQYWLGRKIGVKPFRWAIGDKAYEQANKVTGSPTFIALALLLPYFPDSLVCFFAGASKMKFWTFFFVALIMRSVGVAGICFFGSGILSMDTWTPVFAALGTLPTLML
ncbi:MAG: hypothetical protein NTV44_05415, partial [Firmicutes bacterium]|nr:hypothetical protein [Bacillota bacterium]